MTRRSFSGKSGGLSDDERQANISQFLGTSSRIHRASKRAVLRGDTLCSLANKLYDNPAAWLLLALKNDLPLDTDRDGEPLAQIHAGQTLTLPDAYEVESFMQNPESPAVVALYTDEHGLVMPRTRFCGNCGRETLAMAMGCVVCGIDMDCPADEQTSVEEEEAEDEEEDQEEDQEEEEEEEEDEEDEEEDEDEEEEEDEECWVEDKDFKEAGTRQSEATTYAASADSQGASSVIPVRGDLSESMTGFDFLPQAQDRTVISKLQPPQSSGRDTAPSQQSQPAQDHTVISNLRSQPADIQSQSIFPPSPHAPAQTPAPQENRPADGEYFDSAWNINTAPFPLSSSAQVVESVVEGPPRQLRVMLQLQVQRQWTTIYEYEISADEGVIIQYRRSKEPRKIWKSLPATQMRKMAWNHFCGNWDNICSEYWST
jgi:hypothetical protein